MVFVFLGRKWPWISVPQSGIDASRVGCPRTTHCIFRDCSKESRVAWLDRKWSMCVASKILLELDDLNCVKEIVNAYN